MFFHVFKTWAIANLIHPVILFLFAFIDEGEWTMTIDEVGYVLIFLLLSFIISIPSLVIGRIFIYPIIKTHLSPYEKFVLWAIAVLVAILINFYGFMLILARELGGNLYFLIPSAIAAFLSILLRAKSFFLLNLTINQSNNGNNLV